MTMANFYYLKNYTNAFKKSEEQIKEEQMTIEEYFKAEKEEYAFLKEGTK